MGLKVQMSQFLIVHDTTLKLNGLNQRLLAVLCVVLCIIWVLVWIIIFLIVTFLVFFLASSLTALNCGECAPHYLAKYPAAYSVTMF